MFLFSAKLALHRVRCSGIHVQPTMGDQVEVLVEIGEFRRELAVEKDQLVYAIEQELGRLGKDGVLAYFSCDPGSRPSNKQVYILQRWDEKWGTYVDVSDMDQVKTGDRLVCTLQQLLDSASSSRDAVDFDTSKGKVSMEYIKFIHLTIFKPVKYVIPDISLRFNVWLYVCIYIM